MKILSNISSLQASRQLLQTSRAISKSLERLSTGKRVNSPADDSVAFSIATKLNAQIRGLRQANLNINQAQGLVQTADAGISSQIEIIQKMRELALQAANSSLSTSDLDQINTSLAALRDEFIQIANTTEFNDIYLLNSSAEDIELLVGADASDTLTISGQSLTANDVFKKTPGLGSFDVDNTYSLTNGGSELLTADFNNDGIQDIFKHDSSNINIKLGNGDGSFGATITTAASFTTSKSTLTQAGDFNEDGIVDLALSESGSPNVYIYTGNGDGTFTLDNTFGVGFGSPLDGDVGDINGDGHLDLLTLAPSNDFAALLYGDGTGSFSTGATFDTEADESEIQLEDLDGDGDLDIIGGFGNGKGGTPILGVYLNNGAGGFGSVSTFSVGSVFGDFSLGDIDNDGDQDVVIGNSTALNVLLNDGSGSFGSVITQAINSDTGGELADFNGDGILDFVSAGSVSHVEIFIGSGDGTFQAGVTYDTSGVGQANRIAVADFDNDGVTDIVASKNLDSTLDILLGNSKVVTALSDIQIDNPEDAEALLNVFDDALDTLTSRRSELASILESLEINLDSNLLKAENFEEARSNAEDVDLALETAELVRQQILQQAQIAALTQANTQAQIVSTLLSEL